MLNLQNFALTCMNETTLFMTLVGIVVTYAAYCLAEYLLGATPMQRARGLDKLTDLACTGIGVAVLYILYMKLPDILHIVGEAVNIDVPRQSIEKLIAESGSYFTDLFNRLVNFQRAIFILVTVLGSVPYTVPISIYVSHSTQDLQWMMHWALVNVGLYRVLSHLALYSRDLLLLGLILSIPPQTRSLSSILCGLGLSLPSLTILMWRWCVEENISNAIPAKLSVNDAVNAAKTLVLGGYDLGSKLQELNMMLDLALGLALAAAYGLGQIVSKTTHIIHIR